jgi:hypothetical protein
MSLIRSTSIIGNTITRQFNGFNVRVRESDGYIHATDMCKIGKKRWAKYIENKTTKEFIEELSTSVEIPTNLLIQSITTGTNENRGTWVHPHIATHMAQWISNIFAVKVSGWIDQWNQSVENNQIYIYELNNLIRSKSDQKEKEIQKILSVKLNANIEVKTKYGYIDLINDVDIIEIKTADKWKSALGQILAYSDNYPNHKKWLYLFGGNYDIDVIGLCNKFDVNVKYI